MEAPAGWSREARASLWLKPAMAVAGALVLGAVLSSVRLDPDGVVGRHAFQGSAADARELLTVVVGTMITVTSLVFALTVVALQIASTQFSPRLLRSFLRDPGTQAVLSTFVGTVAYSLAGLHTVGSRAEGGEEFVPRLAVSGALVLALLSVGMLVYYIHHVTSSIRIDTIMKGVEHATLGVIRRHLPVLGEPVVLPPARPDPCVVVTADRSGYLQAGDVRRLVERARRGGVCVRLVPRVGWFVVAGEPLFEAWRPDGGRPPESVLSDVLAHVTLAPERRAEGDVGLGLRQLVDIASRAAAPSTNDVYTAVQAIHHLTAILAEAVTRSFATKVVVDADGQPRLVMPIMDCETHLRVVCTQLRQGGGDRHPRMAVAMLRMLAVLGARAGTPSRRDVIAEQAALLVDDAERIVRQPRDLDEVREAKAAVDDVLARSAQRDPSQGPTGVRG